MHKTSWPESHQKPFLKAVTYAYAWAFNSPHFMGQRMFRMYQSSHYFFIKIMHQIQLLQWKLPPVIKSVTFRHLNKSVVHGACVLNKESPNFQNPLAFNQNHNQNHYQNHYQNQNSSSMTRISNVLPTGHIFVLYLTFLKHNIKL